MIYLILLIFGVLAGCTTVLFGFGGGFVAVPVLYSVLLAAAGPDSPVGQSAMHIAVATSTCAMIFGASLATLRHRRAGTLQWAHVRPLMAYIAAGAALGAVAATRLEGAWLRWAFVAYLGLTILDCLLRAGFRDTNVAGAAGEAGKAGKAGMRPMGGLQTASAGLGIGAVAALLGVGGSVMTVPLMRRRGASMTAATAMANPLSLPMAAAGTGMYILAAWQDGAALGGAYAGYVDLRACAALVLGSWAGIRLAAPWIGRISDRAHANAFIALLCLVLGVMLLS